MDEPDNIYKEFICKCPPYFYGKLCEIFVIPDYALKFSNNGINDFVQIQGPENDLTEVSILVKIDWVKYYLLKFDLQNWTYFSSIYLFLLQHNSIISTFNFKSI